MSAAAPDDQAIQVAWNALKSALREVYAIDRAFALAYLSSATNALRNVAQAKSNDLKRISEAGPRSFSARN